LSSFFASALGVEEELDGEALDEDEDEGDVPEAPLLEGDELPEGDDALEELLDGGVLELEDDEDGEEEDGALEDFLASSRPQAVRANAAATAMRSALFIEFLWVSGVGGLKAARNSKTLK
jgi:hypothetical protein